MAAHKAHKASVGDDEAAGRGDTGTLQLLWSERELPLYHRSSSQVEKRLVQDVQAEIRRFEDARAKAVTQFAVLYTENRKKLGEEISLLFQIHQMMLEDRDYCEAIMGTIQNERVCAEYAVSQTAKQFAKTFSNMEDKYMQGRAADVKDISNRVIAILTDKPTDETLAGEPFILAAPDLAPSETAQLDQTTVLALVTSGGSVNSHTAIFARTMGIPAVIGMGTELKEEYNAKEIALDGATGVVYIEPDEAVLKQLREQKAQEDEHEWLLNQYRGKETKTRDGRRIELCANIGNPKDLDAVLKNDAEGIGLFRSEFLYLESATYPSEEMQFEAYKTVAEKMQGKRVVIRTLDIGADKQADYFELPHEENPAMGLRAIRICLTRPEILRTQLRAIYRASHYGKVAIMFPMITSVEEVRQAETICTEVREQLEQENIPFNPETELGIMIETPAAAIISDDLAKEADSFSVGTNDLTQYTLAVDRQNRNLGPFNNPHHKAILRLIQTAAENAHAAGIWVGICGELGADEAMTEAFLKIGIDELSVSPSAILGLRARIAGMNQENSKN